MAKYHQKFLDTYGDSDAARKTQKRKAVGEDPVFRNKPKTHERRIGNDANKNRFND